MFKKLNYLKKLIKKIICFIYLRISLLKNILDRREVIIGKLPESIIDILAYIWKYAAKPHIEHIQCKKAGIKSNLTGKNVFLFSARACSVYFWMSSAWYFYWYLYKAKLKVYPIKDIIAYR